MGGRGQGGSVATDWHTENRPNGPKFGLINPTCVRDETSQLSLTQESPALPLCPLAHSHLRPTPGMLLSAFFCFGLCFVLTMATPFIYGCVRFTDRTSFSATALPAVACISCTQ